MMERNIRTQEFILDGKGDELLIINRSSLTGTGQPMTNVVAWAPMSGGFRVGARAIQFYGGSESISIFNGLVEFNLNTCFIADPPSGYNGFLDNAPEGLVEEVTVGWGDDTENDVITSPFGEIQHQYAAAGTYEISISPSFSASNVHSSHGGFFENISVVVPEVILDDGSGDGGFEDDSDGGHEDVNTHG
jgi:hypothetical protein